MSKTPFIEVQEKIRTILIVDDTPANVLLFEAILSEDYVTRTATNGREALDIARKTPPDLILLDIMLPDIDGYEVCRNLKANAATRSIPVIFVTAMLNHGDETHGFDAGAVDYITKPVVNAIVLARVKAHLALKDVQNGLEECNSDLKKRLWNSITTICEKNKKLQSAEMLHKEIQDARAYAEDIVEAVREPLVVLSSNLKILTANHSFYDTFQVTKEETIGNFIYDIGDNQWDIPKLRILFEEILVRHIEFNGYEVEHDFQGIGRKIFLLNARQIFRENTGSHIILLALEDITQRKQLEEERDQLAMIVASSYDAIFSISLDNIILSWNRGAENIFGYTAAEMVGSPIYKIIPPERHHERTCILQTLLRGEKIEAFETTRIRRDGSNVFVLMSTSPIINAKGDVVGNSVIAREISERRT
jgi:PAS domain S-box-containing protein